MNIFKKLLLLLILFNLYSFANEISTNIYLNTEEKEFIKNNPIINVGAETDWPPFDFVEKNEYSGFAKDYLDLIEKKSGLKFNYTFDTWENLLSKTKNKEIDLLPALAKNEDREKFLLFTKQYITNRDYLLARSDDNSINSMDDLKGKTVAISKGFIQEDFFKDNYPEVKIYLTNNLLESIDAIITKKADFLVSNIASLNYNIKKYHLPNLSAKFYFGEKWNQLHMAVRNDYQILRDIVQKSMDSITVNEYNTLVEKWIGKESLIPNSDYNLNLSMLELDFIRNKKTLTIANELGWIPYDYFEDDIAKGYVIDYMKLLCEKIGLEPIFVTDKWSLLLNKFKKGDLDILPVVSYSEKRAPFTNYTKSYLSQEFSIITKKSTTNIINKDDLKNKKIGMVKDWNLTKFFKESFPSTNIIEFETLDDVFNALKDNFIDATIQNKMISSYYINKDYYGLLKIVSPINIKNFDGKLYIGVKKDLAILRDILDKAISTISKEELKNLQDKWLNSSNIIKFTKEEKEFINNKVIKVGTTNNWAPFHFEEKGKLYGLDIDIWNYILDKSNLRTEFKISDKYFELINDLKEKEIDLVISGTKTEDREEYATFVDSYFNIPVGISTLQDENYIKSASELKGKKIAVGKNFTAHKLMEKYYPELDLIFVETALEGIESVADKKAFAYIDLIPVLSYTIKNNGFENVKISGQTGINYDVSLLVRKDYPLLRTIINKVLSRLTIEEKNAIYNKWINTKIETKTDYSLLWKTIAIFLLILLFVIYKNRQLLQYQKKLELAKKDAEKSLKNFKTLIDLNVAGILIIREKKIKYINNEAIKLLKYDSKSELIEKDISNFLDIEDMGNLCKDIDKLKTYEINAIAKDRTYIPVILKGSDIEFDNLPSHIISLVDLTEIKNKEEVMLQQSKMASLGEMIGNIAHQWRQPLSSISTAASGIKLQKEFDQLTDETFYSSLDSITETTKFLSQTIDDFKNYIQDNKLKKEFNIEDNIEKVLSIMKTTFISNLIEVDKKLEKILVNSYGNELNQVLLNILSNSKDALKSIDQDKKIVNIKTYKNGNKAIIEIIDNGGGIDKKIMQKIFEPYFTTKHQSQGTGLGLYMTHKIMTESINGEIKVENCAFNNYKKCTKVTLTIPI